MTDREQLLESALKVMWGELVKAMIEDPTLMEHFIKTDRRLRELGIFPPAHE